MLSPFIMSILLGVLTFILILLWVLLILLVLMQKAKSDGGVGAALGGGMTASAFGADTNNVLSNTTIYATIGFFVLSFVLYLGHIYQRNHTAANVDSLPSISAPAVLDSSADSTAAEPVVAMPASTTDTDAADKK